MILDSFKTVFKIRFYWLLAAGVAVMVFLFSTWLANVRLIAAVFSSSNAAFLQKIKLLFSLTASIQTNFTVFSGFYTVLIALLFGLNLSMIVYFIRQRKTLLKKNGVATSLGGLFSGFLGIGCAACGTVLLGPLLTFIGAGGLIAMMPLGGEEFGILSIIILSISIYLTAKRIQQPVTCTIKA